MCTKFEWNYWVAAGRTSLRSSRRTSRTRSNNFFMNSYHSNISNYVKLIIKASMKWKNWRSSRVPPSTLMPDEDWSRIRTLSWNLQARYRNCKMKLIACMIQEIFRMLNQFAVEIPTLPVNLCLSHLIQFLVECEAVLWECRAAEKGRQAFGTHMVYRETFCQSSCVLFSTLSAGIESMEFRNIRTESLINGGEEWESNTISGSEMPVWTVSQKFSHLQWRRLFKELWGRPTKIADFRSPFWQVPYTSHVCLLEDKVQNWGMYLVTISYGSFALDQRSGDGWFCGWFKIFVICKRNSNARF